MSFSCPEDSSSEVRLPVQVPNSYFQNWGQPVLETQGKAHRPPDSVWTLTMHFYKKDWGGRRGHLGLKFQTPAPRR